MAITNIAPRIGAPELELKPAIFADLLNNAALFASKDGLRPILNAALFELEGNIARVVSTDSYCLLVQEVTLEAPAIEGSFLVPRDALVSFAKQAKAVKRW